MIDELDFDKGNGLITAVIQDADSGAVLMVGYMNREALQRTMEERRVTFWSRTKRRLWQKGETSGNFIDVISVQPDCDGDTVLVQGKPQGPVCHLSTATCFSSADHASTASTLSALEEVIRSRKQEMPENSYTARLFQEGIQKIAQKVGEEAVELSIAAQHPEDQRVLEEAADLVYHLIVLLSARGFALKSVESVLKARMNLHS